MALRPGAIAARQPVEKLLPKRKPRQSKVGTVQPANLPAAPPAEMASEQSRPCREKRLGAAKAPGKAAPGRKGTETSKRSSRKATLAARDKIAGWRDQLGQANGTVALAGELLKVRTKSGGLELLLANEVQRMFELNHRGESVVLKARQMGLSTWIAGRFLLKTVLVPGTVTVQVAHTREAALALFRMVQRMWENLPDALREGPAKRRRNNAGEMSFANDSEIRIVSAAEPNAGRGLTMMNLHCSEVARWQGDAAETLAGLRAALAPGGELVLESTPNGAYGCFYDEWRTAERRGAARHFFPWWMEPGYAGPAATELSDEELLLCSEEGLSPEQIGFRRELRERFGPMVVQEFAEDAVSCFRESGACAFESGAISARLLAVAAPLERRWNGSLLLWRPPIVGRGYVLAADPAGGNADGDFSTLAVLDVATGVQCAELQARLGPRMFAERIALLAREFGGAAVAVERNNHGAAVLAFLESEPGLHLYRGGDGEPGFLTTAQSRAAMLGRLGVLLSTRPELFMSVRLLEECRSFVVKDGGRTEAAAGAHDDLVMAVAIAHAVREEMGSGREPFQARAVK